MSDESRRSADDDPAPVKHADAERVSGEQAEPDADGGPASDSADADADPSDHR